MDQAPVNPGDALAGQELKDQYQAQTYELLGLSEAEFVAMDPLEKNKLINSAYARMYEADPEALKWAGMVGFASEKAGVGMWQASWGAMAPDCASHAIGAPTGEEIYDSLAVGNAGIFNDMYWQHLAFEQGGLEEMQRAFEDGSLTEQELAAWTALSGAKQSLADANASGDEQAIAAAEDQIWEANGLLLAKEQGFVQDLIYDDHRDAFQWASSGMNPLGIDSPVPGGTDFATYREGKEGTDDLGDLDQRMGWITDVMLPEFRAYETNDQADMQAHLDEWTEEAPVAPLPFDCLY